MSEVQINKKNTRKQCTDARRALSASERAGKSAAICAALRSCDTVKEANCIFSYMSTWDEVCLDSFNAWAEENRKTIGLPISGKNGIMQVWQPSSAEAIVTGKYDIREPDAARSRLIQPEDIDLVLVPCVGYDRSGGRIGHGAGYYDRYLPLCKNATFILIAFEAQETDNVPTDENDIYFQSVLNENGFILKGE